MTAADRTAGAAGGHRPVMLREVLEVLHPRAGGIYVDGTFGAGGYSRALLDAAGCTVWGVDRDPDAIAAGAPLAQHYKGRLNLVTGRFGDMARC
jgi:16S rRNA (cytosine1402-N4)-methyltransferase